MKNGYHTTNPKTGLEEYVIPLYKLSENEKFHDLMELSAGLKFEEGIEMRNTLYDLKMKGYYIFHKDDLK